jgi:hypothetical protein
VKLTVRHQSAAALVAEDRLTDEEIARRMQIHRSTLAIWKQQPEFAALVSMHASRLSDQGLKPGIRGRDARAGKSMVRGQKLQTAIQLVAEQMLTDNEIVIRLQVKLRTLLALKQSPLFIRRVNEVRATIGVENFVQGQMERSKTRSPRRP